jgi:hypothetical protein
MEKPYATKAHSQVSALLEQEAEELTRDLTTIEACFDAGDYWGAAMFALGPGLSQEVPRILWSRWRDGRLAVDQLRLALPPAWIHNESPRPAIGERAWLGLFRACGFLSQVAEVRGITSAFAASRRDAPPDTIRIWRGARLESRGRGMSWTQYEEVAQSFAQGGADKYGQPSGVFLAKLPGRAVLAMFADEREEEVVVNPNMLRGRVELVRRVDMSDEAKRRRERHARP